MKKYFKWIIVSICLVIFIIASYMVCSGKDIFVDRYLYDLINKYFINDNMTKIVKVITQLGDVLCIIFVCVVSLVIFRDKKINICIVSNLVIVTMLNSLLKLMFMRDRPNINPLTVENTYSFPSGHSMVSLAFYGYLIYLIYNHINNKKVRWFLISILAILILLVGVSRIYLGVHYASDVIGGFCFSIIYLIIFIDVSKKIIKKI